MKKISKAIGEAAVDAIVANQVEIAVDLAKHGAFDLWLDALSKRKVLLTLKMTEEHTVLRRWDLGKLLRQEVEFTEDYSKEETEEVMDRLASFLELWARKCRKAIKTKTKP